MTNGPPEAPETLPSHEGQRSSLVARAWTWVRDATSNLFREDPEVAKILTQEFVREFVNGFRGMLRDQRDIASGSQGDDVSFMHLLYINSTRAMQSAFDALVQDTARLQNLSPRARVQVMTRLMQECGTPGSGEL